MRTRAIVVISVVAVAGLVVLAILWRSGAGTAAHDPAPAAAPASDPLPTPAPPETAEVERRRTPIPRPARSPDPTAAPEVGAESDPTADSDDTDDFPAVQGASQDLAGDLRAAMREVTPGLVECLAGWHETQPDVFVGRAVFAFQLDGEGIAEMDVLDVETVPEGTLTCLGDVLWEDVDWPAVDEPLEVTWPIQVSVAED